MARLRESTVFADQGRTVTVVESLELRTSRTSRGRFTIGNLKPITVVVKVPDRSYVFDIDTSIADSK